MKKLITVIALLMVISTINCNKTNSVNSNENPTGVVTVSPTATPVSNSSPNPSSTHELGQEDSQDKSTDEGNTEEVHFKPGKNSATFRNIVARGTTDGYIVKAHDGQIMTVNIKAIQESKNPELKKNIAFDILNDNDKGKPLNDKPSNNWSGKLPVTGDYIISINGAPGNVEYILDIKVE